MQRELKQWKAKERSKSKALQSKANHCNAKPSSAKQCKATQSKIKALQIQSKQIRTKQSNAMQWYSKQCNGKQCNTKHSGPNPGGRNMWQLVFGKFTYNVVFSISFTITFLLAWTLATHRNMWQTCIHCLRHFFSHRLSFFALKRKHLIGVAPGSFSTSSNFGTISVIWLEDATATSFDMRRRYRWSDKYFEGQKEPGIYLKHTERAPEAQHHVRKESQAAPFTLSTSSQESPQINAQPWAAEDRPIIFEDVDGVLNRYEAGAPTLESGLLANLARVVRNTNSNLVISSQWRKYPDDHMPRLKDALVAAGIEPERIIGETPVVCVGVSGPETRFPSPRPVPNPQTWVPGPAFLVPSTQSRVPKDSHSRYKIRYKSLLPWQEFASCTRVCILYKSLHA